MADFTKLPRCHHEDFKLWHPNRQCVGGWLKKKAGNTTDKTFGSSFLNKGNWQKRWFVIEDEITGKENYELSYFHTPDDRSPQRSYPLENATVLFTGGEAFQLTLSDGRLVHLATEREDIREKWYETLLRVIEIATARDLAIRKREMEEEQEEHEAHFEEKSERFDESMQYDGREEGTRGSARVGGPGYSPEMLLQGQQQQQDERNVQKVHKRRSPSVRLDIDISTIPPSSVQRRQFEEMFISDICKAIDIEDESVVEIYSIKPAVNMNWLIVVEFDVYLPRENIQSLYEEFGYEDFDDEELHYKAEERRVERQAELLETLHELLTDTSSPLYNGFITCKLDPTFSANLLEEEDSQEPELYSADARVLNIMNRYKDAHVPANYADPSHFTITLVFEGESHDLLVPDITYMRQRHAFIWPFEVKQALGMIGTMQEHWVEPTALVPKNVARNLSHPVRFEPSVRVGGQVCLNAARVIPGATYEVEVDDLRTEVLMNLTDEEMMDIKTTFEKYDTNGDGTVSRFEIEQLVRQRTKDRRDEIERKFQEHLNGEGITEQEIQQAEESKRQHLQACTESQIKLLKMFESADQDGDGDLSLTEFMLAESWWLRCTLNPTNAHLF